uniref:Uncharacterized protein n=1 Tax=Brassica oleracea TaxID=3712 RepID=A0A3P6DYX6_BRAOL|nr:unnamed protein product [Brassica oleracea]
MCCSSYSSFLFHLKQIGSCLFLPFLAFSSYIVHFLFKNLQCSE